MTSNPYRGAPVRRKSSPRRRNPKLDYFKGYQCLNNVSGVVRCVGSDKVCFTDSNSTNPCVASDAELWRQGIRSLTARDKEFYRQQLKGDYAEDTRMGIFGRSSSVQAHVAMADKSRAELMNATV